MKKITLYLLTLITALHVSSACQSRAIPPNDNKTLSAVPSSADSSSVFFKIEEVSRRKVEGGEEVIWLAKHDSKAGAARFKIRMILRESTGDLPMAFSEGAFLKEKDSQPSEFLRQIAKALEAKGNVTASKS